MTSPAAQPEVAMPNSLERGVETVLRAVGCDWDGQCWRYTAGAERVIDVDLVATALVSYARREEAVIRQRFNYRAEAEAALMDKAGRRAVLTGERPRAKSVERLLLHLGVFAAEPEWALTPFGLSVRGFMNRKGKSK